MKQRIAQLMNRRRAGQPVVQSLKRKRRRAAQAAPTTPGYALAYRFHLEGESTVYEINAAPGLAEGFPVTIRDGGIYYDPVNGKKVIRVWEGKQ